MNKDCFTNQKPRTTTEADLKAPWRAHAGGELFRCDLCGYYFHLGDYWRWVSGGAYKWTNVIVCEKCDNKENPKKIFDLLRRREKKMKTIYSYFAAEWIKQDIPSFRTRMNLKT